MKKIIFALAAFSTPFIAAAAAPTNFKEFVELLLKILQNAIAILMAALLVGITYGVAVYMMNSDNEKKREEIKGYLLWAVIGIAVVMGMWGLVGIINSTVFGGAIGIPFIKPPA